MIWAFLAYLLAGYSSYSTLSNDGVILSFVQEDLEVRVARSELADISWTTDAYGDPAITVKLRPEKAAEFADLTSQSIGKAVTVLVCGEVVVEPVIRDTIDGGTILLTGHLGRIDDATFMQLQSGGCDVSP